MAIFNWLVFIADLLWISDGVRWVWRQLDPTNVEWRSLTDQEDDD